jgi:hypothetical protein
MWSGPDGYSYEIRPDPKDNFVSEAMTLRG